MLLCFFLGNQDINDEIIQFQLGRYISSSKAFWRIFSFPIHERHPTIQQLSVHLENGQRIYFTEDNAGQHAYAQNGTTLTKFFEPCQVDFYAQKLLYCEVTSFYTWDKKTWSRKKRGNPVNGYPGIFKDEALARVYTVHPSQKECFYLCILLHEVRGPKSFEDLRTVCGELCSTYREACLKRSLLEDDAHWNTALSEAAISQSPASLRNLFAI